MFQVDYDIKYISGISNSAADALSLYPYIQAESVAVNTIAFDPAILDKVRSSYTSDTFFGPIIASPTNYANIYEFDNGLLFFENRLCVPRERTIPEYLLSLHHDGQNHFGYEKTYEKITRDYFWPGLDKDVKTYIKSCESCAQQGINSTSPGTSSLHANPRWTFHRGGNGFRRPHSQV